MRLTWDPKRSEYVFDYSVIEHQRTKLASNNGFRWNPVLKRWYTRDKAVACRLMRYADPAALERLRDLHPEAETDSMRLYVDAKGNFVLECSAANPLALTAGFSYHGRSRKWFTRHSLIAARMLNYADDTTRTFIEQKEAIRKRLVTLSRATDCDEPIPVPDGRNLYGYQKAGVAYLRENGQGMIGDEMGLGKTVQALCYVNDDPAIRRVLIICPASLKINWQRECNRWLLDKKLHVGIADSQFWPRMNPLLDHGEVVIINYDVLHKHEAALRTQRWDVLIGDEFHYCKTGAGTRRAVHVIGGEYDNKKVEPIPATRRVLMSGTFQPNRVRELWVPLSYLDPHTWHSKKWFLTRFCGDNGSGASNVEELNELLRGYMVRRLKADVLTDLPPKVWQVIELPADERLLAAERKVVEEGQRKIAELKQAVDSARVQGDEYQLRDAIRMLRQAEFVGGLGEIAKIRHETARAKVPQVIAHLKDCLEGGSKVVCFAHHRDVIEQISEPFGKQCVTLTGEHSQIERQASVDRFQSDPGCTLFVGNILAAGVGLTLTASSHVVFAEQDWTPGNMKQAEDRCHRIGQKDSVLVQYIVMEGSLDAHMARTLASKSEIAEAVLDATQPMKLHDEQLLLDQVFAEVAA